MSRRTRTPSLRLRRLLDLGVFICTSGARMTAASSPWGITINGKPSSNLSGGKEKEKRRLKKLGQLGPVRVTHLTNEQQLKTGLRPILVAHISRFFATNRKSPLINPERRALLDGNHGE